LLVLLVAVLSSSCAGTFSRKYEYDEDIHLALDGSATVYLNASIPALVALRGLDLDPDPRARFDRNKVRALYETPVSHVESLTTSRRDNRRYVHLRLAVSDMRRLSEAAPFSWSRYQLEPNGDVMIYRQTIGPSAGRDVRNAGWTGAEIVAFRLHLPSRVPSHNAPSRTIERGNIIVWDQPLVERIKGRPIAIEVEMDRQSILVRTLTLFGITVLLAGLTFAAAIWWVVRRARGAPAPQLTSDRR
jgi:hypothetical protein